MELNRIDFERAVKSLSNDLLITDFTDKSQLKNSIARAQSFASDVEVLNKLMADLNEQVRAAQKHVA